MTKPLSVVIPALDAEETIGQQLAALTTQPWPGGGEIIVADNGSTDGTCDVVRRHQHELDAKKHRGKHTNCDNSTVTISLVECSEIAGASHARNAGVAQAKYDKLAFCDADDVVACDWVSEIGAALDHHDAVGGRLALDTINPEWVVLSRGASLSANELPLFDGFFPVLSSCNFAIRRDLFVELGGFDETYFGNEDAELSLRLHQRGADTHFAPNAVVNYRLRSNLRDIFRQARQWGESNARLRDRLPSPPSPQAALRSWIWLAAKTPRLTDPRMRARWVYVAGLRVGLASAAVGRGARR